jgi:DNA-binding SARP family transcriptional activator
MWRTPSGQRRPIHVALLLDDAHHVPQGSPGHELLSELLSVLPGNGHLVLAARAPLALPLSRLRASGEALVVDATTLAFSSEEVERFASLRHVPVGVLSAVGGWPALAELTATAGPGVVADYLWEELLAGLSPDQRRALAVLVTLGGADEEIATATGLPGLEHLLRGLPLVSATADGWWSAHPLWTRAAAGGLTPDEATRARRAAAEVLRRRGQLHEAMTQLLDARAWDDVRDLLVQVCHSLSPAVPRDVLASWWERLPAEVQDAPEGLLLAGIRTEVFDPDRALDLLERAYRGADGIGDVALSAVQSMILIAFWRNDTRRLPELVDRLGRLAEGRPDEGALHSVVRGLLTMDPGSVLELLHSTPAVNDPHLAPIVDWLRAQLLLLHVGDPAAAVRFATAALDRAEVTLRSSARAELVESLRLTGRVEEAAAHVPALIAELEYAVVRSPRQLLAAIVTTEVSGRDSQAVDLLTTLRTDVYVSPFAWAPLARLLAEAVHLVCAGDDEAAARHLREVSSQPPARLRSWLRISPASLPLLYVLVPETRPIWDTMTAPGCYGEMRTAAAALTALRERRSLAEVRAADLDWTRVRGQLPVPWTVELATARSAAGRQDASAVLQALGHAARGPLRALLQSPVASVAATARTLLAGLPARPPHTLRVLALGPLRLERDSVEVVDPDLRRERVRHMLGLMLVFRTVPRTRMTLELWPDLEDSAGARNLRVTLNYLQRLLEPERDEHEAPWFLRSTAGVLELTRDGIGVDVWEFEAALDHAEQAERQAAPSLGIESYRRAVALYRGEFLADLPYAPWLESERVRLTGRFVRAATRLGQLLLVQGQLDQVERLARRALQSDEYCEKAYCLLAAVDLRRDDGASAGRVLSVCRDKLAELGVAPSPATQRLQAELNRTRALGLPTPPRRTAPA